MINKFIMYLLFVATVFQYGEFIVSRYFVPVVAIFLVMSLFFITNPRMKKVHVEILLIHVLTIAIFYISIFIGNSKVEYIYFDMIKIFVAMISSYLAFYYTSTVDAADLKKVFTIMFLMVLVFLIIELFLRLSPYINDIDILLQNFYVLKVNSPFMTDSNAVAIYAMFYLMLYIYCVKEKIYTNKTIINVTFLLFTFFIIFTLSRAVWVCLFILFLILYYENRLKITRQILFLISISLLPFAIFLMFNLIVKDGSGNTKILIISNTIAQISYVPIIDLIFGFGLHEGAYKYSFEEGKYSHLLITMLLGQVGALGLIAYFGFFLFFLYRFRFYTYKYFIILFVVGLSFIPPFLETVFLVHGVIFGLIENKSIYLKKVGAINE